MPFEVQPSPTRGWAIRLTGDVTATDLKRGVLAVVANGGWEEPLLWDFRAISAFGLETPDVDDTAAFVQKHTRCFPPRGRIAVITRSELGDRAAAHYRERCEPDTRALIRIVRTEEAAREWLHPSVEPAA